MIAIIDYRMGNLRSVEKALQVAGGRTKVTSDPKDIEKCDKVVFPGVGAFGSAMKELKKLKLVAPIREAIAEGKPFLGLCLGLQLLFTKSEEAPGVKGLCVFEGESKKFKFKSSAFKVPHMGWNNIAKNGKIKTKNPEILRGVADGAYMYFVHSYYVRPKDKSIILTTTDYGGDFVSGVCRDNVYAFQFHPEKSQALGLKILKNFVKL
ncbi:MAG: imidazole glycerol phosphate synthase subunit HisH [Candidatus Omnitrophica bacterium]|nr:imidazole glycerol phosphate synthase subunit HisH [Candidatus Omnitrophota bacterium]